MWTWGVILTLVWGAYLYPDAEAVVRVANYQLLTSQTLDNALYCLGTSQDTLSVSKLQAQTLASLWTLPLPFLNPTTPVTFAVSSDALYVAINVQWNRTESLPYLTSSQNPRSGTTHGLVVAVDRDSGQLLEMTWAGSCLGANAYLTDLAPLHTGYMASGFDLCNSGIWLGTQQWERYLPSKGNCLASALTSTAQSMYLSSACTGDVAGTTHSQPPSLLPVVLRLTTMGDVLWGRVLSLAQPVATMVEAATVIPLAEVDYICVVVVANSTTATLLDSTGALQWTTVLPSPTVRGVSLDPAKGVLLTTSDTLLWLSYDSVLRASRAFTGGSIRGAVGLVAGLDSMIVSFSSAGAMFNSTSSGEVSMVAARLHSPFAQGNCSALCSSCFGPSPNACFDCVSYQAAPFMCGSCHPACTACFGPARAQCRTCAVGYRLLDSECVLDLNCPVGQFTDQQLGACQSCDSSCSSCAGPGTQACLACASGLVRNDKVCVAACPAYRFPALGQCQDCSQPCASCSGPSSFNCTACATGALLAFGACVSQCPDGSYERTEQCVQCAEGCGSCAGPDHCSSCLGAYSLLNAHCFQSCPPGYFSQSNQCLPCISNCSQCTSPFTCSLCQSGFYWNQTSCLPVPQCAKGAFFNGSLCASCHPNCATCWGATVNLCSSCATGYFLKGSSCAEAMKVCAQGQFLTSNNTCQVCAHGCAQCQNSTLCTACQSGYLLAASSCTTTCPAGTYAWDTQCQSCAPHCLQCESASVCSKCATQWLLSNSTCVAVCPQDTTALQGVCSACSLGCSQCNGPVCSECKAGLYLDGSLCIACPPQCSTCLQSELCLSCASAFALYNSSCVLGCPLGLVPVSGECQQCPVACQQCSTPNTCDICEVSLDQAGRYHLASGVCDVSAVDCYPGYSMKAGKCRAEGISALDYFWAAVQLAS